MGLKITTLSQEPVNNSPLLNLKSFIKLVRVVIYDYETFQLNSCVVMEGNRK